MKRYITLGLAMTLALASCEDVPAPYEIMSDGSTQGGGTEQNFEPQGQGTSDDPYNVAAINMIDPGTGVTTTTEYYVRGRVSQLKEFGDSYGNYSYYISDDGTTKNQYYIYRGYGLNGDKFTAASDLSLGDSVVIVGKIVNYNGTLEFAQGNKLVYLNGKTSSSGGSSTPAEPIAGAKGSGTATDPYNVAGVLNYTNVLPADQNSASEVYFSGIVSSVKEISTKDKFNNATFYLSDDGKAANEFCVYRCLGIDKADIFSADLVKVGDKVTICGKVVNYRGNTPETVQKEAYIVSINGETTNPGADPDNDNQGGNDTPDVSGDCITFDISSNCFNIPSDKQTAANTYTCGNYSITLTPAGDGSYYYNSRDKYVILGKQGATLEFNGFDFDVAKIEITGRSGASANTIQNIYVGSEAVSSQTKGVQGTNVYVIKEGYRAAGTHFVLKVESAHNTQFTEVKVYKVKDAN